MELAAAIEALKALNKPCRIELHTDSQYLKNGITIWMPSWKARGWKRKNGDPVVNVDLWQMLDSYICKHQITWHWVRGHNGDYYNERVDTMARLAMWEGRIK
jgi:ribonuclease HI